MNDLLYIGSQTILIERLPGIFSENPKCCLNNYISEQLKTDNYIYLQVPVVLLLIQYFEFSENMALQGTAPAPAYNASLSPLSSTKDRNSPEGLLSNVLGESNST